MSIAQTPVMVIMPDGSGQAMASQIANALGYPHADIITGSPIQAAEQIGVSGKSPLYLVVDIGELSTNDALPQIDVLAKQCPPTALVIVLGQTNDVHLYRELIGRGVIEYLNHPVKVDDVRNAFLNKIGVNKTSQPSSVLAFMSATAGDGSSTVAMNTAYCLAELHDQPTVLIDMDFQFGMAARNLDITSKYGLRDLFEHQERGIDSTLIDKMLVSYGKNLKIISAPTDLQFLPNVDPETIRTLIQSLRERYPYIVLDIPHMWSMWVAAALGHSDYRILVAQLWLKSVTHASRMLGVWEDIGIDRDSIQLIINRSGSRYKEALRAPDFERVVGRQINFSLNNDTKTIVNAENKGQTVLQVGRSTLAQQIKDMVSSFLKHSSGSHFDNQSNQLHATDHQNIKYITRQ
jgi:pilus assembly protein CpaE